MILFKHLLVGSNLLLPMSGHMSEQTDRMVVKLLLILQSTKPARLQGGRILLPLSLSTEHPRY